MVQTGSPSHPRWYVLQAKPHQEARALDTLRSHHYACFLPLCRGKKPRSEGHSITGEPLFSRYLFVQLSHVESQAWDVQRLDGVSRLLKLNNRFATVPDPVISALLNLNPMHALREVEGEVEHTDMFSVMDMLSDQADGEARALTLIEMICQPQKAVVVAALLPEAA